jgi:general secretion pathway protein J
MNVAFMNIPPAPKANGFTLVELMVALFIFSLIAVAGVTLLRSSADGQIALKERLSSHSALLRTANLLEADLAQVAARQVRDIAGNEVAAFSTAPVSGLSGGPILFAFTRGGLGTSEDVRPAIGRVAYGFTNGSLSRFAWSATDGAAAPQPAIMLDKLQNVTLRFRGNQGDWATVWSPVNTSELPRAVEMTLTASGKPPFRLVMLVGTQLRPAKIEPPENALPPPGSGPT